VRRRSGEELAPNRSIWAVRARVALSAALALLAAARLAESLPVGATVGGYDYALITGNAQAFARGANPYGAYPLAFGEGVGTNLNPPVVLLATQALAEIDPVPGFRAWYAASLGMFVAGIVLLVRPAGASRPPGMWIVWACASASLWDTVQNGQIYMPLFLATAGAWVALRRGSRVLAAVLIGLLIAIRPSFALWPAYLLLASPPAVTVALGAFATAGFLSLVPVVVFGPGIYGAWLTAVAAHTPLAAPVDASLPATFGRMGLGGLGVALAAALLLGLAVHIRRRHLSGMAASAIALAAMLVAGPVSEPGYALFVLPVLLARPWTPALAAAAVLLLTPAGLVHHAAGLSPVLYVLAGGVYTFALVLILAEVVRDPGPAKRERISRADARLGSAS
jgi:hypothetical protein